MRSFHCHTTAYREKRKQGNCKEGVGFKIHQESSL